MVFFPLAHGRGGLFSKLEHTPTHPNTTPIALGCFLRFFFLCLKPLEETPTEVPIFFSLLGAPSSVQVSWTLPQTIPLSPPILHGLFNGHNEGNLDPLKGYVRHFVRLEVCPDHTLAINVDQQCLCSAELHSRCLREDRPLEVCGPDLKTLILLHLTVQNPNLKNLR